MIWIAIAAIIFTLDYFIKRWAKKELSSQEKREIGNTGFFFQLTRNYGFACNRLDSKPMVVKVLHTLVIVVIGFYALLEVFFKKGKGCTAFGMACILGGGMSNWYDRVKQGYVVDYLGLPVFKKLLFNLSDLFVFLGSVFLLLGELIGE